MSVFSIRSQLYTHCTPVLERVFQQKELTLGIHSSAPDIRRVPCVADLSTLVLRDYPEVGCASNHFAIALEQDREHVLFLPLFSFQSIRDPTANIFLGP